MNQDERLNAIMNRVGQAEELHEEVVPMELAQPSSFLKIVKARHYNWNSKHFRKLFGMRFSVKVPPFEQLNTIFYPRTEYAAPIFIFFCMITKRKVIAHLNINCPFDDAGYKRQWIEPLVDRLGKYAAFESADRYPEWMKKYRNESTIYGLFPRDRLEDLSNCCFDYLDYYMDMLATLTPETDSVRTQAIENFHAQWVDDVRTQDKAQGMIAKMIGAKKARRIFYEVTT
jgi:hypothetical protein